MVRCGRPDGIAPSRDGARDWWSYPVISGIGGLLSSRDGVRPTVLILAWRMCSSRCQWGRCGIVLSFGSIDARTVCVFPRRSSVKKSN